MLEFGRGGYKAQATKGPCSRLDANKAIPLKALTNCGLHFLFIHFFFFYSENNFYKENTQVAS